MLPAEVGELTDAFTLEMPGRLLQGQLTDPFLDSPLRQLLNPLWSENLVNALFHEFA